MHVRKKRIIAVAAVVTAGAVAVAAAPALSAQQRGQADPPGAGQPTGPGPKHRMGPGMGMGPGTGPGWRQGERPRQGRQRHEGACRAKLPASGTVTAEQRDAVSWLAEEEKLSHDLYVAFGEKFDDPRFANIARAETNHLRAMRVLLGRYDIADPTQGKAAGSFTSARAQSMYDRLLAQGSASLTEALAVGATVEKDDIAALKAARAQIEAPDVDRVTTHLIRASQMHLRAFSH